MSDVSESPTEEHNAWVSENRPDLPVDENTKKDNFIQKLVTKVRPALSEEASFLIPFLSCFFAACYCVCVFNIGRLNINGAQSAEKRPSLFKLCKLDNDVTMTIRGLGGRSGLDSCSSATNFRIK